jgi:hypothetical protein
MTGLNAALITTGFYPVAFIQGRDRIGPGLNFMGAVSYRDMASDAIRRIFNIVFNQGPVKRVLEGGYGLKPMPRHFLRIFVATGAKLYDFTLAPPPSHPMGEMGINIFCPVFIRMASLASGKGFPGQRLAFSPKTGIGIVCSIPMAIGAAGAVFGKSFLGAGSLTMDAVLVYFNHVLVGKFPVGRRVFDMAFG